MARKKGDSINVSMFMALKVSEVSGIPVLFMSNPGLGKTTSVEIFAKLRGMDVVTLRGNSESPETIHGFEALGNFVPEAGKAVVAAHTRPSWMNRVLENSKKGIRTLLFLDELTTANEYVQAALLQLIFGRQCGVEELPKDCLIVAAGNYMNNLTSSMTMLSPVLNRFMIYNITPEVGDLATFLCKYDGAIGNDGEIKDNMAELEKQLREIDSQEIKLENNVRNMIAEHIERSIRETTKMLMSSGERPIDMSITELQSIYSDVDDNDPNLYGFPTMRTLGYLRDVTIACYQCFGKAGIQSDNYRNMINGLCGIGLRRGGKDVHYEIIKTRIGKEYHDSMIQAANEIEKMGNNKFSEYEKFFVGMVKTAESKTEKDEKNKFSLPELQAIINKVNELSIDKDMSGIERPINPEVLTKLCEIVKTTNKDVLNYKAKTSEDADLPIETFTKLVTTWNTIADFINLTNSIVGNPSNGYKSSVTQEMKRNIDELRPTALKLRTLKKLKLGDDASLAKCIPDVKEIKTK